MAESNERPSYRISDLHESDCLRERLEALGPRALTNSELIAILLRVGVQAENVVQVGQRLLQEFGGLRGLHRTPFKDLIDQHCMWEATASQVKAAIESGRRLALESPKGTLERVSESMKTLIRLFPLTQLPLPDATRNLFPKFNKPGMTSV